MFTPYGDVIANTWHVTTQNHTPKVVRVTHRDSWEDNEVGERLLTRVKGLRGGLGRLDRGGRWPAEGRPVGGEDARGSEKAEEE